MSDEVASRDDSMGYDTDAQIAGDLQRRPEMKFVRRDAANYSTRVGRDAFLIELLLRLLYGAAWMSVVALAVGFLVSVCSPMVKV